VSTAHHPPADRRAPRPASAVLRRSGRPVRGLGAAAGLVAVVVATTSCAGLPVEQTARALPAARAQVAAPAPAVSVEARGAAGAVPYARPLAVTATDGALTSVTGSGPDGTQVTGAIGPDGRWTSTSTLFPASTYALTAHVRDAAGVDRALPLSVRTRAAARTYSVALSPGDDAVVGVGQAVQVRLGAPVEDPAVRADVERHLRVVTTPAVKGSWRWTSPTELRYRGRQPWAAGTTVRVTAALTHVRVPGGSWGAADRTTSYRVGDAVTSVVDVAAHTMTVSRNGRVLRVLQASMGKPGFETRNGTFVVLEKFADRVMDSATVDLPPGTPAYRTAVQDAVRLTNSGTFTHGAPWSVSSQGRANVSHGCINLSPADADWFYRLATRGDVVRVVGSTVGPSLTDAGSQDWNLTYAQWRSGSALAR